MGIFWVLFWRGLVTGATTPQQFHTYADTVFDAFARFDPVWGTYVGIHDYDARLADYSKRNIERQIQYLKDSRKRLLSMDTSGWPVDDAIDYKLLLSNVWQRLFELEKFPYWRKSPFIYSDQCLNGIHYLALRDFAPMRERLPSLLGRLREIPVVAGTAKANLTEPVLIFVETSIDAIDEGTKMITAVSAAFMDSFPQYRGEIEAARDNAIAALRDFNSFCRNLKPRATATCAIGRKNFEAMLTQVHFLDFGVDSLLNLGNSIYADVDSQMKALEALLPPADTLARFPIPSLSRSDVLEYYRWEIEQMKEYVKASGYATIPDSFGSCIPMETPAFLRGTIRGIAYEPPAPLDEFQTGFFYVRPLPESLTAAQKADYASYIAKRGFRGSVVHEGYPGHHMQLLLANQNPSKIRKLQDDLILIEGWALYCEEMVYRQGLFGQDLRQWRGILGGIRFRAVRILVDVGLQIGTFTPESALHFMNEKLGENNYYYTAEIRWYSAGPTSALSYLTGKTIIMQMRQKASQKEGQEFDLKAFHDRLLSEGSIAPTLIAQKYGW